MQVVPTLRESGAHYRLVVNLRPPPTRLSLADLCGSASGEPIAPPVSLLGRIAELESRIAAASAALDCPITIDGHQLLTQRAALMGNRRSGRHSVGGATRLVSCVDRWVAICLARADDIDMLPAWLQTTVDFANPWATIVEVAAASHARAFVDRARLLGIAASVLGETADPRPVIVTHRGPQKPLRSMAGVSVVDLSSLWAGPLCGALLAQAGATVTKIESTLRPDGARRGNRQFYELLNGAKSQRTIDFQSASGRRQLRDAIHNADVVIEASRPRALQQLGCSVESFDDATGPSVWVSITAHGRDASSGDLIGFGDDAAVAGGLVVVGPDGPNFCGDAIADPLAGIFAAVSALEALRSNTRSHLDVAMARVARWAVG